MLRPLLQSENILGVTLRSLLNLFWTHEKCFLTNDHMRVLRHDYVSQCRQRPKDILTKHLLRGKRSLPIPLKPQDGVFPMSTKYEPVRTRLGVISRREAHFLQQQVEVE